MASATPAEPTLPSNHAPVAYVYLRVGGTSIKSIDDTTNHYIVDARTYITAPSQYISSTDVITEGTTNLYFTDTRALNAVATALGLKANDADVVHDTGDETVDGYKTFSKPVKAGWDNSQN